MIPDADPTFLELRDVVVRRGRWHLGPVSVALRRGECLGVLGPSASGKSTLLDAIAGLETVSAGTIGSASADLADPRDAPPHRRGMAYLLQDLGLFAHQTAAGNVNLVASAHGRDPSHARELLSRLGLAGREDAFPSDLSGGERQRLAIARVLAAGAPILLLDEPLAHLPPLASASVAAVIGDERKRTGATLIVTGHELRQIAPFQPDGLLVLDGGQVVAAGPSRDLAERPQTARAAAALGFGVFLAARRDGGVWSCALGPFRVPDPAPESGRWCFAWRPGEVILATEGAPARVIGRHVSERGSCLTVALPDAEPLEVPFPAGVPTPVEVRLAGSVPALVFDDR